MPAARKWNQYAGDLIYRFLPSGPAYVGARDNMAAGKLRNVANEVSAARAAIAAGWFIPPNLLVKGECVTQRYNDFVDSDIRSGGKFDGSVVEGVIAF